MIETVKECVGQARSGDFEWSARCANLPASDGFGSANGCVTGSGDHDEYVLEGGNETLPPRPWDWGAAVKSSVFDYCDDNFCDDYFCVFAAAILAVSPAVMTVNFAGSIAFLKAAFTCASVSALIFVSKSLLHA